MRRSVCQVAIAVLLALLSAGIDAQPAGYCALVATLSVSAYSDDSGDGQGITASGAHTEHGTLAAGSSVPFGTHVLVAGYGAGRVQDRGSLITDAHLDIWMSEDGDAWEWGRQSLPVVMFWGQ